ncbi:E3 ubiquitin-protein ligase LNX [Panthera uncia]|uniref:E3 ubiquitin-protein ligase LNX n=1 Tax=Panthera uncia TaxID=29064 RepID=UPI0020FFC5AB|nr:E3 ubiquitin-protein ligase LNX [Panthera uncia]
MSQPDPACPPDPSSAPLCVVCGQAHSPEENHFYTYAEDVDDDLVCHICLQALLDPLDTPCGHTYCTLCLTSFLVEKDFCPVDRKPVVLQHCKKSSILVNKLLNKLLVTCPFPEYCTEVLQRCDLEQHFQTSQGTHRWQTDGVTAPAGGEQQVHSTYLPLILSTYIVTFLGIPVRMASGQPRVLLRNEVLRTFQLTQASERRVHLVVSRQVRLQSPDIFQEAGWDSNGSQSPGPGDRSNTPKPLHPVVTCHEKVVSVRKDPSESLGMTVAGGASHREWDLPIYVISVEPGGVISRDGRIKTGDILLNVNGIELTEVSRSEAVALLKSTSSLVVLKALEVKEREPEEASSSPAALDSNHNVAPARDWSPSWIMWLELPRYLYNCKDVILRRNTAGSLGFCIVGGYEEYNGDKPFFIKSIVEGTPAYNDGRIRCGDILLAVNGRSTSGMIHACLARMLKELKGKITLTLVSWPGTFL